MEHLSLASWPTVRSVHFVGIGGIGLSAIARVLREDGYRVSGSDAQQTALTAELAGLGMDISHGHRAENIGSADLLVASSAVPADNVEILEAQRRAIPVVKRGQLLGEMMADRIGIAIAGTHGKTTTSALTSFVLSELGCDPTFIVGGILLNMGTNARRGHGPHIVVEADEYDCTFLDLRPKVAVVTVIEMDHPDCFADVEQVTLAFEGFARLLPEGGALVGCADQPRVLQLLRKVGGGLPIEVITYGLVVGAMWQAREIRDNSWGGMSFVALRSGQPIGECSQRLPGVHNVANALAVLAVAHWLKLDLTRVRDALTRFQGVARRFEIKGEAQGITVVDDYAHHPTEIRATLAAARRRYGRRHLWVLFQPHTYSRTKALMDEFARSFGQADHVLVTEVYAAREHNDLGISAQELVQRMQHNDARYVATLDQAVTQLQDSLQPGDVLLTLGAGDGCQVGEALLQRFAHSPNTADEMGVR